MSGGLKTILPMAALGATGFGLAGMGPLAGILGSTGAAGGAAEGAGLLGNAFGSADMLAANTLGNGIGAAAPLSGLTAESMGADFINGVPQNFGARLSALKDGIMPGEWDWMKGADAGMKLMHNDQQQPQNQAIQMQAPVRQPMAQPQHSFLDIANQQQTQDDLKRQAWLHNLGGIY